MKYPGGLHKNGTIGFVAPSFGCATEPYMSAFNNALRKWREAGYETKLGPNCYASDGIGISSSPQNCGVELTDGYCDRESDVLISCGGGELMCEILDYVDYERIAQSKPKWFMGYSDNTNFTFTLTTMCDVASVYGPCAASFGTEPGHKALDDAFGILTGDSIDASGEICALTGYDKWEIEQLKSEENPLAGYNLTEVSHPKRYLGLGDQVEEVSQLTMKGRLLGGCLDCLVNLCGTSYDQVSQFNKKYADDGVLWFLESCDLNPLSIRRAMWELEHAGWFEKASGFIIGRPRNYGEEIMGLDNYKAVYDIISHYKVPILMDADLGHLPPALPLITGSIAQVNSSDDSWSIEMKLI